LAFSDPNHRLARELRIKVPGTHRHSTVVSGLGAYAGREIEADELVLRVAGLFHDISKKDAPRLFVEAGLGSRQLPRPIGTVEELRIILDHPALSAAILQKHGFPLEIIQAVREHHGTTRSRLSLTPEMRRHIGEHELIYPGPKPSTRESSILMIADSVEAALNHYRRTNDWPAVPTHEFILGIIHRVGTELRAAAQFDDYVFGRFDQQRVEEAMAKFMRRYYCGLDVDSSSKPPMK
jgi:hypothetical protein